jgi:hypothetical protein
VSSSKNEIIVLLTPHIVGDTEVSKRSDQMRQRLDAARAEVAASHPGYLRPSFARRMYTEAASALARGDAEAALAKAEWGLRAMPADPDLAMLARHCRLELDSSREEAEELRQAIELIQSQSR